MVLAASIRAAHRRRRNRVLEILLRRDHQTEPQHPRSLLELDFASFHKSQATHDDRIRDEQAGIGTEFSSHQTLC